MGYAVYEGRNRWQGYGVPAYCDYPGCKEKIDRGMGYQLEEEQETGETPTIFCCEKHRYEPLETFEIESKETKEWVNHILTDESWQKWRDSEPEEVEKYQKMLDNMRSETN